MIILPWNCRGCASDLFIAICRDLIRTHKPLIVVLVETWVNGHNADNIVDKLGFKFAIREESIGFPGGIWILWSDSDISLTPISRSRQFIHMVISYNDFLRFFTAVYGSPQISTRKQLWKDLSSISSQITGAWASIGDFNAMMSPSNKQGGKPLSQYDCQDFQNCVA